ncbi:hypothetical protein V6N11_022492 [Hibiscus sabdariffa]|uniref:Uncharacterized protein n=1 Tax=Hibiscus sabdariffa TaxID=183260 RepID=A0ABR2TJC1_9ROSI
MLLITSDPLLFVAVKDQNGFLQIADDVRNFLNFAIETVEVFTLITLSSFPLDFIWTIVSLNMFMFCHQQHRFAM